MNKLMSDSRLLTVQQMKECSVSSLDIEDFRALFGDEVIVTEELFAKYHAELHFNIYKQHTFSFLLSDIKEKEYCKQENLLYSSFADFVLLFRDLYEVFIIMYGVEYADYFHTYTLQQLTENTNIEGAKMFARMYINDV